MQDHEQDQARTLDLSEYPKIHPTGATIEIDENGEEILVMPTTRPGVMIGGKEFARKERIYKCAPKTPPIHPSQDVRDTLHR